MFETKYIFIIRLNKNACKNILESFPYFVGSNQWKKKKKQKQKTGVWTRVFHVSLHSIRFLFGEILIFLKRLEVTYFSFFF